MSIMQHLSKLSPSELSFLLYSSVNCCHCSWSQLSLKHFSVPLCIWDISVCMQDVA